MEIRRVDDRDREVCPSCHEVFWGQYSIGVGALVIHQRKVLLVRRAQEPGKGLWTNPGGYVEQHESIEETVVRELMEETGVTAEVVGIAALRDQPRDNHNLYVVFQMRYVEGDPTPDGIEVDQAGFFSLEEMQQMNVAAMTRWLVDVGLRGQAGLMMHHEPTHSPLSSHHLFRVPLDMRDMH